MQISTAKRHRFFFEREAHSHAEATKQAWLAAGGQVDYIGEWHTHPQRVPVQSGVDRTEWRKLTVARPEQSPLVVVVVGTTALHVELLRGDAQLMMQPIDI